MDYCTELRLSMRAKMFSSGFYYENIAQQRDKYIIELRKKKREEFINKKRFKIENENITEKKISIKREIELEKIEKINEQLKKNSINLVVNAIRDLKKIIYNSDDLTITQNICKITIDQVLYWFSQCIIEEIQYESSILMLYFSFKISLGLLFSEENPIINIIFSIFPRSSQRVKEALYTILMNISIDSKKLAFEIASNQKFDLLIDQLLNLNSENLIPAGLQAISSIILSSSIKLPNINLLKIVKALESNRSLEGTPETLNLILENYENLEITEDLLSAIIKYSCSDIIIIQKPSFKIIQKIIEDTSHIDAFIKQDGYEMIKIGLLNNKLSEDTILLVILLSNYQIIHEKNLLSIEVYKKLNDFLLVENNFIKKNILIIFFNSILYKNINISLIISDVIASICILLGNSDIDIIYNCLVTLETLLHQVESQEIHHVISELNLYQFESIIADLEVHKNSEICCKARCISKLIYNI